MKLELDSNTLKFLYKPAALLLVVSMFLVASIFTGYSYVTARIAEVKEIKANEIALSKKISVLETVSTIIPEDITFLDVVLPYRMSILYGLNQVKNQALKSGLFVTNIRTGSPTADKEGVFKSLISFTVEGDESSVYEYLNSFNKILPLVTIDKIRIEKRASIVSANVNLFVYSSELPKSIPALTASVNSLSVAEIDLLRELSTYILPTFVESKPTTENVELREDPFI